MAHPQTLGKYSILDVLGSGSMGTVYRASDPALGRIVAIKLLHSKYGPTPESGELWTRLRREESTVAYLDHPTIVSLYEFSDTDPAGPYFVMEYVDGRALEDYLRRGVSLSLAQTLELMSKLLDGLGYAHAQEIVHRDIKPVNLFITREGQLKITDFGIAKVGALQQTRLGIRIGTPEYLAPEQLTRDYIDPRCDLYAAGALLFRLLTGRPTFTGTTAEVMYQVCHATPARVSSLNPAVPALLDSVVAKALANDPEDRVQSAWHFGDAINLVRKSLRLTATSLVPQSTNPAVTTRTIAPDQTSGVRGWVEEAKGVRRTEPVPRAEWVPRAGTAGPHRDAISAETLDRTAQVLIRFIGPIATTLVKRTAPVARNERDLYVRLAEGIMDAKERQRFLTQVIHQS
jgi:eukaryotic-like serine/threonine-protein kinase